MEVKIAEPIDYKNLTSVHKNSIYSLFEILFNKKSEASFKFHIKNPELVKKKLTRMVALGMDNLQVITDFDWTLSKFVHNGQVNPTCYGIFEQDPEMTAEVQTKLRMLRQTYHPIEVDQHLSVAVKTPIMLEWWNLTHRVIESASIHRDALQATVRSCNLVLRDNVPEFVAKLHKSKIPLLIFSAGLGNVIELLLERLDICYDNVRVVSNFMDFNDEGLLVGFQEPTIHTYNKTISTVTNSEYNVKVLSKRPSVILLGDSTGDPHMSDGITPTTETVDANTILKIGFLNTKAETLLETYKNMYDIVLVDDDTFNVPLEVLNCIIGSDSLEI